MDPRQPDSALSSPASGTGTRLPVMEVFYSLQGEGYHQGKAAYFIRLAGCDIGCSWCDVKESWEQAPYPLKDIRELLAQARQFASRMIIITGGEPLLHPLGPLTGLLRGSGLRTHLETSGSSPLSGEWDWVCLSPKKFKPPREESYLKADELKVVVYHPSDLAWAEQQASRVRENCRLYLQPEWSRCDRMTPLIVDYIKENPAWGLSLQGHKYIRIP